MMIKDRTRGGLWLLAVLLNTGAVAQTQPRVPTDPNKVVLMSDTHIDSRGLTRGQHDAVGAFRECVRQVAEMSPRPAAVLLLGDLTENNSVESFRLFRELLAPWDRAGIKFYLTLGNHDRAATFFKALPEFRDRTAVPGGPVSQLVELPLADFAVIETAGTGSPDWFGEVAKGDRAWLNTVLARQTDKPLFICGHHPFDRRPEGVDLLQSQTFKAWIYGHYHRRTVEITKEDLRKIAIPSTGFPENDSGYYVLEMSRQSGITAFRFVFHRTWGNPAEGTEVLKAHYPPVRPPALCPEPAELTTGAGGYRIKDGEVIRYTPQAAGAREAAEKLSGYWKKSNGDAPEVRAISQGLPEDGAVTITTPPAPDRLPDEGYRLEVSASGVRLTASGAPGFFYGVQTLRQLTPRADVRALPCVKILDAPRFGWRGIMIDESRHFIGKPTVLKILDAMASLKLNRFHWHLTDGSGWRLEIKRFPELTTVGAVGDCSDPKRPAQFYTQSDVREILAYARERHIMVIPEIEMPAHSTSAMTAYPHLSCTGKPEFQYCAGNDEVLRFLEQVLDETLELFDAPYIHIGGDECPKDLWAKCPKCQARKKAHGLKDEHELQSWMVRHFDRYLASKGRRLVGWDSITEGGLAEGAVVMAYQNWDLAGAAVRQGNDVVIAIHTALYLDYEQFAVPDGYRYFQRHVNSCESLVSFNPVAGIPAEKRGKVLGIQGCSWGEVCYDGKDAEWKLFPRAAAIAERAWSPETKVGWESFKRKAPQIRSRLKGMGLNVAPYANPAWYLPVAKWEAGERAGDWSARSWKIEGGFNRAGAYVVRFVSTRGQHAVRVRGVALLRDGEKLASREGEAVVGAKSRTADYPFTLPAAAKPDSVITLSAEMRADGGADASGVICVIPKGDEGKWED